jgi:primosomal protein N' (replication factor Y) (superfamily II helicase)
LSLPDFRAAERTFQLMAQVAGRAGRGVRPGEVYIQTLCPDHYSITLAAAQDYEGFFRHESELRRSLAYPPFARLIGITGTGPEPTRLARGMEQMAEALRARWAGAGVQILGPAVSPIPRLRGRFREQILVKGKLGRDDKAWLIDRALEEQRNSPGLEFQVDVDPVNMM